MKDAEREAWTKHVVKAEMQRSIDRTARKSKYGAIKKEVNGIQFASTKEANRYIQLAMLQAAKKIANLVLQPKFSLDVCETCLGFYVADFKYDDLETQTTIVEDSKGFRTPMYRWKRKHMQAQYGITITET